ncbi:GrpB family protein [Streptomyces sp. NPDC102381]|uniref:GrpB family protein n=1 Tax=Streptomyces sp. NPDC102381 TaxID=3366164 RepID=UPI00382185E9
MHICTAGSEWERRHLLFRDWLRRDTADRAAYARHKQHLAEQDWPDMNAYAAAKGPLIAEISERAEAWARATGWTPGA